MSKPRTVYVFSYDIADDTRRTRMADLLSSQGTRVQRSVFELSGDETWLRTFVERALRPQCFSSECDSLRCYVLCARCRALATQWGASPQLLDPQRPLVF